MATATKKAAPKKAAVPKEVGYPKGWTVTDIGAEGYSVTHDGANDDGTNSGGCSFKVHSLSDVDAVIQHRGKIPD